MAKVGPTSNYAGPKRVAIFGGGVTGLTAAHELVERGFEVEVFEPTEPSLTDWPPGEEPRATCAVGGVARTQWSRADRPNPYVSASPSGMVSTQALRLDSERKLAGELVHFKKDSAELDGANHTVVEQAATVILDLLQQPLGRPPGYDGLLVEVRGYVDVAEYHGRKADGEPDTRLDHCRAQAVMDCLHTTLKTLLNVPDDEGLKKFVRLRCTGLGLARGTEFTVPDDERRTATFHIVQDYLPGEHGFRFFPSFHRHLRDTMKRTPLPVEDAEPFVESFRTAFDNLVPATSQAVFIASRPPYVLPRRRVASLQELFDLLVRALETSGCELSDINRWTLGMFKYMTACPKRRKTYEDISWWDFMKGDRFSAQFATYLESVPQALLGYRASECDARTYGNITLQLLRDQLYDTECPDGVLNGPTTTVWLDPWRRYLENQGVKFRRGRLTGFEVVANGTEKPAFPKVLVWNRPDDPPQRTLVVRDYYVVALPVFAIHEMLNDATNAALEGRDIQCIRQFRLPEMVRRLNSVQYYFQSPLNILRGHVLYADAPWGLSSISQPQFWARKRGWWDGYLNVLTVCIGDWRTAGPINARGQMKTAWECTRQQLAEGIWCQIKNSLPKGMRVPDPFLYHLDDRIEFSPVTDTPVHVTAGLLMNPPGTQALRPGRLDPDHLDMGYELCHGNVVFAGTYTQTYTRLTTMESANESARHAVNAILHAESRNGMQYEPCGIWNLERHEMTDVQYLTDIDAALYEQGLPHFVDILDPDELPKEWLKGALNLPGFASLFGPR